MTFFLVFAIVSVSSETIFLLGILFLHLTCHKNYTNPWT